MIKLYSTGCPRCVVLKKKLDAKGMNYEVVSDVALMESLGFTSVPMLEVDDKMMDYVEANKWINEQQ